MLKSLTRLASIAALTTLSFALPAQASDKGEVLRNANEVVNDLRHDPAFGTARNMLQGAEAIYIVPKLVKAGFIFGAEGGEGVLLHRTGRGFDFLVESFLSLSSNSRHWIFDTPRFCRIRSGSTPWR